MVMGEAPERFESSVHINAYGPTISAPCNWSTRAGRTAHAVQSIGVETGRNAAVFGSEGSIWLPDYQMAQTMTIRPNGGEPYEVSIPGRSTVLNIKSGRPPGAQPAGRAQAGLDACGQPGGAAAHG